MNRDLTRFIKYIWKQNKFGFFYKILLHKSFAKRSIGIRLSVSRIRDVRKCTKDEDRVAAVGSVHVRVAVCGEDAEHEMLSIIKAHLYVSIAKRRSRYKRRPYKLR